MNDRLTEDLALLIHVAQCRNKLLDDGRAHVDAYAERLQALTASLDHAEACQQELLGCLSRLLRPARVDEIEEIENNGHILPNMRSEPTYRQ
jgi:hypothetical protein